MATTLGEYMHWLAANGGRCQSGLGPDDAIGMVPVTKLIAASGRSVVVSSGDQQEVLAPATIAYIDRRLNVLSPFAYNVRN